MSKEEKREKLKRGGKRLAIYTFIASIATALGMELSPEQINWVAGAIIQFVGVLDFIINVKNGKNDKNI